MRLFLSLSLLLLCSLSCFAQNSNTARPAPTPQVVTKWRASPTPTPERGVMEFIEDYVVLPFIVLCGLAVVAGLGYWAYISVAVKESRKRNEIKQLTTERGELKERQREAFSEREQKGDLDKELTELLQKTADRYIHLFDYMPRVPFRAMIYRDFHFQDSDNCPGLYYKNGYDYIGVDTEVLNEVSPEEANDYIKHQLIHAWLVWKGKENAHNAEFNRKAKEVGVREVGDGAEGVA